MTSRFGVVNLIVAVVVATGWNNHSDETMWWACVFIYIYMCVCVYVYIHNVHDMSIFIFTYMNEYIWCVWVYVWVKCLK